LYETGFLGLAQRVIAPILWRHGNANRLAFALRLEDRVQYQVLEL
jgi:hypothetical protein